MAHLGSEKSGGGEVMRLLLVEDEPALRRAYARILAEAGCSVEQAGSAAEAVAALDIHSFDVIFSDITMPGISGIQLLRMIRERDLDVPVVLVTGNPSLETAMQALEYGALRYLLKPVDNKTLIEVAFKAGKFARLARLKREASDYLNEGDKQLGDRSALEASLVRALESLWMAYQPIVNFPARKLMAYEALVRTREPTIPHPGALFSAAERLGRVHDVGRAIRAKVGAMLAASAPPCDIFINLHPRDLLDETLYSSDSPLAPFARSIVLEITERAALDDAAGVPKRVERLRSLGFRVAIDDLGAGYAGLSYFAQLTPEVVKIDIALVRDIHKQPVKRKLVGSLTSVCKELGMLVVAEGVETAAERDVVAELGCDLQQGYLFAKPGPPFPPIAW